MKLARASLLCAAAALTGAVTMTAQGPPPQPAATGTTMAKTWTDADLDALMKDIGKTYGALGKAVQAQDPAELKTNADKLESLFEQVDDFWSSRNVKDASDWADDAAEHADHIEDAADEKDFAKATEHGKLLLGTCGSCHSKYRDKDPNGGYRIKP